MEIKHLEEFVVLAETGNFTEAAELLYLSQPTLSKHILSLETEIGVQLFDRTTRAVKISEFGILLLPFAKKIVKENDQFTSLLQGRIAHQKETLIVGSIRSLAQYNITDILANFKKTRPQSTVKIYRAQSTGAYVGSQRLKEALRNHKCEIAFLRDYENISDDDIIKIPYFNDFLVAVIQSSNPMSKYKYITMPMLEHIDLLTIEENSFLHQICKKACENSGFEPNIIFTDTKPENLIDLVSNGMGIALLMKHLALYSAHANATIVDIAPKIQSNICLCYLKSTKLSDAAKEFIECTIAQREKLEKQNQYSI